MAKGLLLEILTALTRHQVRLATVACAGPLVVATLAGAIPLLFALGRMLFGAGLRGEQPLGKSVGGP